MPNERKQAMRGGRGGFGMGSPRRGRPPVFRPMVRRPGLWRPMLLLWWPWGLMGFGGLFALFLLVMFLR